MLRFGNVTTPFAPVVPIVLPDRVPPVGLSPMAIATVASGTAAPVESVTRTDTEGAIMAPASVCVGCCTNEMSPVLANTVSGTTLVGVICGGNDESVACTWTLNVPGVVAAPLINPLLLGVSPGGRSLILQLMGGIPPREDRTLL